MARFDRKSSYFQRLVISYCIIAFLLTTVFTCVVVSLITRNVLREMLSTAQRAADVAAADVNNCINTAVADMSRLFLEPSVSGLFIKINTVSDATAGQDSSLTADNIYDIYKCMKTFAYANVSAKSVQEYLLYIPSMNCMVSYSIRYAFDTASIGDIVYNEGYEALRSHLSVASNSRICTLQLNDVNESIYVIMPINDYATTDAAKSLRLVLCAELSGSEMRKALENASIVAQAPFALIDENNVPFLTMGEYNAQEIDSALSVFSNVDDFGIRASSCIPRSVLNARVRQAVIIPLSVVLLGLILLFGICYRYALRLYRPIYTVFMYADLEKASSLTGQHSLLGRPYMPRLPLNVVETVGETAEVDLDFENLPQVGDELTTIQWALQEARKNAKRNSTLAFTQYLQYLCDGKYHNETFVREEFRRYDIYFSEDYFEIHILRLDIASRPEDMQTAILQSAQRQLHDGFSRLCHAEAETDSGIPSAFLEFLEGKCIIIILNERGSMDTTLIGDLYSCVQTYLADNFGSDIACVLGCSIARPGVLSIQASYKGAEKALDQDLFCSDSSSIFFESDNPIPGQFDYRMTHNDEQYITDMLRHGRSAEACLRMQKIVEDNASSRSREHIDLILMLLASLPLRLLRECGYEPAEVFKLSDDALFAMLREQSRLHLRTDKLALCYKQTGDFFSSRMQRLSLTEETLSMYIAREYVNDLSVGAAADFFGMSVSHFSGSVRQLTGKTFLELLNGYRVRSAADEILSTKKQLCDIAETAGFANYRTFARVFSRNYGVSPEEYRKAHRQEDL